MITAFDTDALIYAAQPDNSDGDGVRRLLEDATLDGFRVGSVVLLPETLSKPRRDQHHEETLDLVRVLSYLRLEPVMQTTAVAAVELAAKYTLKAADAIHLATAVHEGATRFVTNNTRDFDADVITEVEIVRPTEL